MADDAAPRLEWRPVPWAPTYWVSNRGQVSSRGRWGRPRLLTPYRSPNGYLLVQIFRRPGKARRVYVHVLMAGLWLGPRPPRHRLTHCNGDKTDNRLENLAYVTRSADAPATEEPHV